VRKKAVVSAPNYCGRDKGKTFMIEEWPADRAEKWALRAMLAYNRGGGKIDVVGVQGMGMEGIFMLGVDTFLRGQIQAEEVIPIMDELLGCVQIIRDPKKRDPQTNFPVTSPIISDDDIEEVATRMWLRSEVIKLHSGFCPADAISKLISAIMARQLSPNMQTSQQA